LLRTQIALEEVVVGEHTPSGSHTSEGSESEESIKESEEDAEENGSKLTLYKGATLVGIALLVVLALGFKVDVGFAAFTIALALWLVAPREQGGVLRDMPWSVILLVSGILTYVGVLEKIGTIDYVQNVIAGLGSPLIAALAASYVGGIVSFFAATAAVLGASIPLVAPILQDSALSAIGVVTAVAIASAIVDASPISTNGALLLANVQNMEERVFFRQLLLWGVIVTVLGPLLAWFIFVVIGIP
jgi:di/tricarboxylate transporter